MKRTDKSQFTLPALNTHSTVDYAPTSKTARRASRFFYAKNSPAEAGESNVRLVANAALGVLVEDVATRHIESDLDGVAGAGLGARGNAGDEVGTVVDDLDLTVTLLGLTDVQVQYLWASA